MNGIKMKQNSELVPNPSQLNDIQLNVYVVMSLSGQFYDKNRRLVNDVLEARMFTELRKVRCYATKLVKHYKQPTPFILTFSGKLSNVQHDSFRPKSKKL